MKGEAVIDSLARDSVEAIMGVVEYVTADGWVGVRHPVTGRFDELQVGRCLVLGPGVRAFEEGWLT